ncbi:hypothetical protein SLEP1_g57203 [Rubroshorea leprosula]|uniref:RNase H type-1 domain-containing protein n=1 Tax=Rubroshorea leprosula TaxID=152421 RepID=A0AAV5MKR7_9ROSI|nr:hypothetical protein SLEP1_g57203 [Rubroshorea leprosula]
MSGLLRDMPPSPRNNSKLREARNKDTPSATHHGQVVACNYPALSKMVVPTKSRGSEKLNLKPNSSKLNKELLKKNNKLEKQLDGIQKSIDKLKSLRSRQQVLDLDSALLSMPITVEPYQERSAEGKPEDGEDLLSRHVQEDHRLENVEQKAEPIKLVETVSLDSEELEKTVKIGTKLTAEERRELLEFLKANKDVFAWTTVEMPRIPTEFAVHKLSTYPTRKPVLASRLIGWVVELNDYDIKFEPHTAIKGQALADFLVECHLTDVEEVIALHPIWAFCVDGATNVRGSRAGAVLVGPYGFKSKHTLRFKFSATNNATEYEALIYGLKLASELRAQNIKVFNDSQLVVNQVNEDCDVKDPQLVHYSSVVSQLKTETKERSPKEKRSEGEEFPFREGNSVKNSEVDWELHSSGFVLGIFLQQRSLFGGQRGE